MRDYGRVYSSFWTSADTRTLSDDARLLALYLLCGPHGTIAGVCRLPDGYVAEDLQWPPARVSEGFRELSAKQFANRCMTTNWVWIRKFLDWNKPENPNQWTAARKVLATVPDQCVWKSEFVRKFALAAGDPAPLRRKGSATVRKEFATQDQDQEQEQEQEQETGSVPEAVNAVALSMWLEYRKAAKKPIKAFSLPALHKKLAKFGDHAAQLSAVEHSIANQYVGVYAESYTNGSGKPYRRAKTVEQIEAEEKARANR